MTPEGGRVGGDRGRVIGIAASLAGACLALMTAGCGSCGGAAPIAELAEATGTVERDLAAEPTTWEAAAVGAGFHLGDGVRTGAGARARVKLAAGGSLRLEPNTVIRFQQGGGSRSNFKLDLGEMVIEGGDGVGFDTFLGFARIATGTRVRVRMQNGGRLGFDVLVGQAQIEGPNGGRLSANQGFDVSIGGAIIESRGGAALGPQGPPDAGPPPAPPDAGPGDEVEGGGYAVEVEGRAARVRNAEGQSRTIAVGSGRVQDGERVTVPRGGTLRVTGETGTASIVGDAEVLIGGEGGALVSVVRGGRYSFVAQGGDLVAAVPGGTLRLRGAAGSRVEADVEIQRNLSANIAARQGTTEVQSASGTTVLEQGDETTLLRSGAVEGTVEAPSRADFSIDAGESPTVHDARAPTAVRIRFSCPGEGVVEISNNGSFTRPSSVGRGTGSAIVLVQAGTRPYRVRCAAGDGFETEPRARGTLRVVRDSGQTQLPRGAPHNFVDADGRNYIVLYQNLLPVLTFRWTRAPQAGGYTLNVTPQGNGRPITQRVNQANVEFQSGRLDEGTYRWYFEVDGTPPRRSPTTTLRIDFDNAAPTAYVRSPADGAAQAGQQARVEGAALEGASVSVAGRALSMDSQRRFSGEVTAPTDEDCIAIRIAHPTRGVHYYLRRVGGT